MSINQRSSLRKSLNIIEIDDNKKDLRVQKLRGRYLFRATVRLVLEYIDWIKDDISIMDQAINNGIDGTAFQSERKSTIERHLLNLQDRSILLIRPQLRTKNDKSHILQLIKKFGAFKKYPDDSKNSIASICRYQYFGPGRIIVRQNHPANFLYYIINGHVELTKIEKDHITDETSVINAGTLGRGDMFGEVALLHNIPRSTTVTTKTPVDLLSINKSHFDRLLKFNLLENWNILQDALVTFNYFNTWDKTTVRDCCIISKIKDYQPNEIILGDGKGMVNYVYFLLSGNCRLIEHMLILEEKRGHEMKYKLYNPNEYETIKQRSRRPSRKIDDDNNDDTEADEIIDSQLENNSASQDYNKLLLNQNTGKEFDIERASVVTTTLQDVVNQWHEITEIAAELMRRPSTLSQQVYPDGVRTVFMKICEFHRGACFGLGEEMRNRRIVSLTPVRCLLVPRYWLLEHNRANIWERVKVFMNSKYPSREKLFNEFVTNRRWMKYKKNLVNDIMKRGKNISSSTTIHDVPYSIRINEQLHGL
ncbi:hypothetical protein PV327_001187 [Microctonus hyperodae]|uniref:Cyclic nucleotide-binding domain-containing protein n=1 Tax=Microctonus hyperodae TaxID=165561 RepID=A0AA39L327_MICHY|nr:hypothetical protein PV327_001187 [Microctonus hyperodae]